MGHWLSRSSLHFASFKYTACVNIPLHAYPTFPVPACWEAGGKFFIFSSLTYYNPLNVLVKRILAMIFLSYFLCSFFLFFFDTALWFLILLPKQHSQLLLTLPSSPVAAARKVTPLLLHREGCQQYQQKTRTGALSCFITEWLWETAETMKSLVQGLRNEHSSNQCLSFSATLRA